MQNVRPTTTMSPCVTGTVKKTRLSDSLEESCELSETEQTSTVSVKELGALGTERIEAGDISDDVELLRSGIATGYRSASVGTRLAQKVNAVGLEHVHRLGSMSKVVHKTILTKCTSTRMLGVDAATLLQLSRNHCVPSSRYSWSKSKQQLPF